MTSIGSVPPRRLHAAAAYARFDRSASRMLSRDPRPTIGPPYSPPRPDRFVTALCRGGPRRSAATSRALAGRRPVPELARPSFGQRAGPQPHRPPGRGSRMVARWSGAAEGLREALDDGIGLAIHGVWRPGHRDEVERGHDSPVNSAVHRVLRLGVVDPAFNRDLVNCSGARSHGRDRGPRR